MSEKGKIIITSKSHPKDRTEFLVLIFAVAILSLLYITLPNFKFFSDGVQFAVEMKYSSDWLLHPHHVLYPLLPQIVRRLTGFGQGDLDFLIGWSQVMGILSLIAFTFLLKKVTGNLKTVLFGITLFAITNGVWYFFVTPNQNSTPLLLNILTLLLIVDTSQRFRVSTGRIIFIAVMIAVSMLGSQVNAALIFPAILVVFGRMKDGKSKSFAGWTLIISTLIFFFLLTFAIGVIFGRFTSAQDFTNWQNSYVFQERWWSSGITDGFSRNVKGNRELLFGEHSGGKSIFLWMLQIPVLIFFLLEFFIAFRTCSAKSIRLNAQTIGLAIAIPIFIFSIFYIPENLNLRVLYVPGFIIFLLPSVEKRYFHEWKFHPRLLIPILILVLLFSANIIGKYKPESAPVSNMFLTDVEEASNYISPDDIVVYPWTDEFHTQALYMQYYIGCDALTVDKLMQVGDQLPDEIFTDFIYGSNRNRNVWLSISLIENTHNTNRLDEKYSDGTSWDEYEIFLETWFGDDAAEIEPAFGGYSRARYREVDQLNQYNTLN